MYIQTPPQTSSGPVTNAYNLDQTGLILQGRNNKIEQTARCAVCVCVLCGHSCVGAGAAEGLITRGRSNRIEQTARCAVCIYTHLWAHAQRTPPSHTHTGPRSSRAPSTWRAASSTVGSQRAVFCLQVCGSLQACGQGEWGAAHFTPAGFFHTTRYSAAAAEVTHMPHACTHTQHAHTTMQPTHATARWQGPPPHAPRDE